MRETHQDRINLRKKKWKEQQGVCGYCNRPVALEHASLDHIIPVEALDENLGEANLIMTCKRCNRMKGNHIVYTNLFDKLVYPMVEVPYFFQWSNIIKNFKDKL